MSITNNTLFTRKPSNPILQASDWPYPANSVFNPAATVLSNGDTLLLVRVEDHRGFSHFTVARSSNGVTDWEIESAPSLEAEPENYPEELWGIEDPRITWLPERKQYAVVYTAYSKTGPMVSLACTKDFRTYERYGAILQPINKDAALFPQKFGDRWAMVHRPTTENQSHIWISYSPDLRHWGEPAVILKARNGGWWDAKKIGLTTQPIETPEGWLLIYHGVRESFDGGLYRVGIALLDRNDPSKVLYRSASWVLGPDAEYERHGDIGNVVFPCGATYIKEQDELRLYYGGADTCVALATAKLHDVLEWLKTQPASLD